MSFSKKKEGTQNLSSRSVSAGKTFGRCFGSITI